MDFCTYTTSWCVMPLCNYSARLQHVKLFRWAGNEHATITSMNCCRFPKFLQCLPCGFWTWSGYLVLLKMTTCRHCNYISGIIMKQEQGGTHATINTIWEQRGTEMSRPYSDIIENRLFLAAAPTWALAPRLAKQSLYWRLTAAATQ